MVFLQHPQCLDYLIISVTVPLAQVLPRPQLILPSKICVFGIYLNFQRHKSLKNQNLSQSESKSYQINSIKSCSSRSFQEHQRHIPIPPKYQLQYNLIFSEEIIQYSRTFAPGSPNVMEPSPCIPPHRELSKDTKNSI